MIKNKLGKQLSKEATRLLDERLERPYNIRKTAKKFKLNPSDLQRYVKEKGK